MLRLAAFAIRKPALTLVASMVVAIALGAIGLGVAHSLSPTIVVVPGTESSRPTAAGEGRAPRRPRPQRKPRSPHFPWRGHSPRSRPIQ